ncbi:MAG: transporter [Gemmatimonadales bacterium]
MSGRTLSGCLALTLAAVPLAAQGLRDKIATELFTFGDCGQPLCLDGSQLVGHGDHFIPAQQQGATSIIDFISNAIGLSVANTPLSATSSGTTFQFEGGLPVKTSVSAGPLYAERSQTLGRGRFYIGATVTAQHFQELRGVPVDRIRLNVGHQDVPPTDSLGDPAFENDVIQVDVALDIDLLVTSLVLSYGLVDGVDIGVAVPLVHTSVSGQSAAQVVPFGAPTPHFFSGTITDPVLVALAATSGSATGLGDVAARLKINVAQGRNAGVAVLADARFPTGDEEDLLGSGGFAGRGLAVASARFADFSPHLNVGYVFRDSELQNNAIIGNLGFDQLLGPWATLVIDMLSEWQLGDSKLTVPPPIVLQAPFPRTLESTNIPVRDDDLLGLSVGVKFTTRRGLTIIANGLFPLRDSAMQPYALWTGGLEYNF